MYRTEMITTIGIFLILIGIFGCVFILIGVFLALLWFIKVGFISIGIILLISIALGFKKLTKMKYG